MSATIILPQIISDYDYYEIELFGDHAETTDSCNLPTYFRSITDIRDRTLLINRCEISETDSDQYASKEGMRLINLYNDLAGIYEDELYYSDSSRRMKPYDQMGQVMINALELCMPKDAKAVTVRLGEKDECFLCPAPYETVLAALYMANQGHLIKVSAVPEADTTQKRLVLFNALAKGMDALPKRFRKDHMDWADEMDYFLGTLQRPGEHDPISSNYTVEILDPRQLATFTEAAPTLQQPKQKVTVLSSRGLKPTRRMTPLGSS